MEQEYSLSSDMETGGAGGHFDSIARKTVGMHYNIAFAIILVLVLALVYLLYKKESFNPTQTLRYQNVSLSGSEALTTTPTTTTGTSSGTTTNTANSNSQPSASVFSQLVQNNFTAPSDIYTNNDPTQGLTSDMTTFCTGAGKPDNNAWGWMLGVASSGDGTGGNYSTDANGNTTDVYGNVITPAATTTTTTGTASTSESMANKNLMAALAGY